MSTPRDQSATNNRVLDEDAHRLAVKMTAQTLRDLNEIRKSLELPPDCIREIAEVYSSSLREVLVMKESAEHARELAEREVDLARRTSRLPMRISSEHRHDKRPINILPNTCAEISVCCQWASFRVEEIEIDGDPSHWIVHCIKVGNRLQSVMGNDSIPGEAFRKDGIMSRVRLDAVLSAMDFTIVVEYVGPESSGKQFTATATGTVIEMPQT